MRYPDETENLYEERRARAQARKLSWDIYSQLKERIQSGVIRPIRPAFTASGEIDPRDTIIDTADVADLAKSRSERPVLLGPLIQSAQTHTGLPGRPPMMARRLILAELEARAVRSETKQKLSAEADDLRGWLKVNHPSHPPVAKKTVENLIRDRYNQITKKPQK